MSLELNTTIPPAPATVRGQPMALGADAKRNSVVYGNGLFVYCRDVENPSKVRAVHRHKRAVTTARVSPSGNYCASGDVEGNLVVWALDNETNTVKFEGQMLAGRVNDIAWTGDNERLMVVGEGKEGFGAAVMLSGSSCGGVTGHSRNIQSVDLRRERPFRAVTGSEDTEVAFHHGPPFKFNLGIKDNSNTVNCVRFSPSGDKFITVSSDKTIHLYDGKTGEKLQKVETADHTGSIYSVSWHPSGKYFFTASADKTCKIFEAESGKVVQTFALPDKTVDYMQMGCAYVGERPVSVSFNGDVNVFDAAKEAPTAVLRGHVKPVTALAVDGDVVITGSSDPSILIWDAQAHDPTKSRRPKAKKMHSSVVSCATTHKGKLYTAGMDDTIAVTDLATNELSIIGKVSGGPNGLCVMQDHLVVSTNKGVYVLGLDGEEKSKLSTTWTPTCAATNGQVLAVGSKPKLYLYALKGGKLAELEVADHHKDKQITALAWSKDGSRLASGDAGREILVWEFDGKLKVLSGPGQMAFHTAAIKSLAFNPSGSHIASASIDTNVIAWSTAALGAKKVKVSQAHLGGVNVVDWLSDKEVVTGGQDCAIRTFLLKE